MNDPSMIFEDSLTEAVTIPRRASLVVSRPVALDAEQVAVRLVRISDSEVDEKAGNSDLPVDLVSPGLKSVCDLLLEHTIMVAGRCFRHRHPPGPSEVHEELESKDAFTRACKIRVNVLVSHGREHFTTPLGAADQHIKSTFASLLAKRAEAHRRLVAWSGRPVPDRDEYDVALIALHIFQILDEEWLGLMPLEERFMLRGEAAPEDLELIQDRATLSGGKSRDPKR
jgi:hypothetical protein